jgi:homoserine O-succinyltransferase/O-acetyltransferase
MPLIVYGNQIPACWPESKRPGRVVSIQSGRTRTECLRVSLINNMPDAALEDTELQFFDLLDQASGNVPVVLSLYSLTGVPRTERGMRHLNSFYLPLDDLWNNECDAVIMTGTEPHQSNLRQEPYWPELANVLEWAERNTVSIILSCLAAHAAVLHGDGIERRRLADKQFGVFEFTKIGDSALTGGASSVLRFPHSRWNEVEAKDLKSCGYTVLTHDAEAGVDSFVKKRKNSLFVHFQGHPEYGEQTLLKEYRRDIRRFLRRERETYPTMPHGYFGVEATASLAKFRNTALADPHEEVMENFPEAAIAGALRNTWRTSASCIYQNWLQYAISRKTEAATFQVPASAFSGVPRKRTALQ